MILFALTFLVPKSLSSVNIVSGVMWTHCFVIYLIISVADWIQLYTT